MIVNSFYSLTLAILTAIPKVGIMSLFILCVKKCEIVLPGVI